MIVTDDPGKKDREKREKELANDNRLLLPRSGLESIKNAALYDRNGRTHFFRDFYLEQTAVCVFLRHFLDYVALEYATELAKIPDSFFQNNNGVLIVIGCAEWKHIKEFETITGLQNVYCDPERVLYTNLRLHPDVNYQNKLPKFSSPHVKSNVISGAISSSVRAMSSSSLQGDPYQQGGAIIIDKDGSVVYFHRDDGPFDHVRIETLMQHFQHAQ